MGASKDIQINTVGKECRGEKTEADKEMQGLIYLWRQAAVAAAIAAAALLCSDRAGQEIHPDEPHHSSWNQSPSAIY